MRYPPDHKRQTRQRILVAAGVVFRRRGFSAAGVDEIMQEAELTAGGFYAHFRSKEELFAAAFLEQLHQSQTLSGDAPSSEAVDIRGAEVGPGDVGPSDVGPRRGERLRGMARRYLSRAHRCRIEQGCPLPPLLADLPRQDVAMRREFQKFLAGSIRRMAETPESLAGRSAADGNTIGKTAQERRAMAALATMVGGVALSRAVADPALADDLLAACREWIDATLETAEPVAPEAGRPNRQATKRKPTTRKKGKPQP
jgi:TetR/AcrR family transcriptional repressor of nem operon